ncbi:MAG: hypothetical protein IE885_03485 [Campylobacterales bacterium]|nr:hypothetical protein [Campylobacterales bacterium]
MKVLLVLFFSFLALSAAPIKSSQLLVVTSKSWMSPTAVLQRYAKHNGQWRKVGEAFEVKIGHKGMGWGLGLHEIPKNATNIKKEGDGKSPAGIFTLGQAFGYDPFRIAYPYEVYKETDYCVDDVNSKYYNQIVDSTAVERDYRSFEHMKFSQNYYKYGIAVAHNAQRKRGAGSCIFIHIKEIPTVGCTVMKEEQIKEVLKWLDPNADPLLVQAPKEEMNALLKSIR